MNQSRFVDQVGGGHYQAAYQHWDMVVDTKMHYLLACATKYVGRDKDDWQQDLQKALSYVIKAKVCSVKGVPLWPTKFVHKWLEEMRFDKHVEELVLAIARADYPTAIEMLQDQIMELEHAAGNNPDR